MILLQRYKDYTEILTSKKKKLIALVDGEVKELLLDTRVDPENSRCFGRWYILECLSTQDIVLKDSDGVEYSFTNNRE
jgi:dTDP-4-dehydrorhamnose 3,5-epimerase-like enzyme